MSRSGFSLIEVIIASAILMASVFVLSELAGLGRKQSQRAALGTRAQEVCERTLSEVLLGDRPLADVENEPLLPPGYEATIDAPSERDDEEELLIFEDPEEESLRESADGVAMESDWLFSVRITPMPQYPGLASVTVSVVQSDETLPRRARFELTRWIEQPLIDPAGDLAGALR